VFDADATGTRALVVAVVAALVLAGCSGSGIGLDGDPFPGDGNDTGGDGGSGLNRTELASLEAGGAGLSSGERARARSLVVGFYDDLPRDASERRATGLAAAERICRVDRRFDRAVTAADLAGGETAANASRRMARAVETLERFDDRLDPAPVRALGAGVDDTDRYVPLVGSYRRLAAASCRAIDRRTNASLERFHVAALAFGVEVTLLGAGADPGTAAAASGAAARVDDGGGDGAGSVPVGLYRLRYLLGDHGYALALSEVHWALRGEMVGVVAYAAVTAASMGVVESLDGVNFTAVVREQGFDRNRTWLRRCGAVGVDADVDRGAIGRAIDEGRTEPVEAVGDVLDGDGDAAACRRRESPRGGSSGG